MLVENVTVTFVGIAGVNQWNPTDLTAVKHTGLLCGVVTSRL